MAAAAPSTPALSGFAGCADHSWLAQLLPDPETEKYAPNNSSRQVRSGHYVLVKPAPLPDTTLVIHSPQMVATLGISEEEAQSETFRRFFSGEQDLVPELKSWCTPYALSIMGQRMVSNCPFQNGNGYGDGRAMSVGEVVVKGQRWEMQLKGSGRTPFCRGGDGRAVLRSSVREFLASEAMFNLGIDTTRALSLVVSGKEKIQRPWYSGQDFLPMFKDPDTMIEEPAAISTRVAPSFLRVGHIDLFARRATGPKVTEQQRREHEMIVEHMLFREYADVAPGEPLAERAEKMLDVVAERLGRMVSGWLRVGFCQGNFNADNCLVGGRTMDYGPFGWMDMYDPLFAKWTGSGQHFAFMNQPVAAIANFMVLVESVGPVLSKDKGEVTKKCEEILVRGQKTIGAAAKDVWRVKLGFAEQDASAAAPLFEELEPLMRKSGIDYTLFWRQLANVAEVSPASGEALLEPLKPAFYNGIKEKGTWTQWLEKWHAAVSKEADGLSGVAARLRAVNPKYVPREWMLVSAYEAADHGDFSLVHELFKLFLHPYEEQPDMAEKYYRCAPKEVLKKGGVAHMS